MGKLIAIRHGQSTWNAENRFTGWVDVDLSEKGMQEAEKSGKLLKELNINFDMCFIYVFGSEILSPKFEHRLPLKN